MSKQRLEAFSDGVIAILITIMVLELRPPAEPTLAGLAALAPVFVSYVLSFVFLAIYWNNHHHLLQAAERVDGRVLWANAHLLFWLSLVPFVTAWIGSSFGTLSIVCYGLVLLFDAIAYFILVRALLALHGPDSLLAEALGEDRKGRISLALYLLALPLAFVDPRLAFAVFVVVAVVWLVPDRRIEERLAGGEAGSRKAAKD